MSKEIFSQDSKEEQLFSELIALIEQSRDNLGSYHHTNANMLRIITSVKFVKKPANNMLPIVRP